MPATKSGVSVAEKWARVTPQRVPDYQQGVQNPRRDWQASTKAATSTYKDAITKSLGNNSFEKGVNKVSSQSFQATTLAKGPNRFAEGVQVSAPKFAAAIEPVLQTIASTTLPPRMPKGDPRNIQRVAAIAKALNDRKLAGG